MNNGLIDVEDLEVELELEFEVEVNDDAVVKDDIHLVSEDIVEDVVDVPTINLVDIDNIKNMNLQEIICDIEKISPEALVDVTIKKRGRKRKSNDKMYFTEVTQRAIVYYNNIDNYAIKNKIYNDYIDYPFNKLAENIINTFKFMYFNDLYKDVKSSVVSNLIEKIHNYRQENGRAYSYFGTITKRFLIKLNNENYEKLKKTDSIDVNTDDDWCETDIVNENHEKDLVNADVNEFIELLILHWEDNVNIVFKKQRDIDIANCIIELFKKRSSIECFNKKAIYLIIREMCNQEAMYITKVMNVMGEQYKTICDNYYNHGMLNDNLFFN